MTVLQSGKSAVQAPPLARPVTRTLLAWCPDWPIAALAMTGRTEWESPVAVIDRGLVHACSASARIEGVSRGIRVREAQARCPELEVFERDDALDTRAFEPAITAIERLVSGVQVVRPGLLAVRGRGPARYYGGELPAAVAILGMLGELGILGARVGIADGPFTAEHAARTTDRVRIVPEGGSAGFLAPLPVSLLAPHEAEAPGLVALLTRLGVRTLGDFAALPVESVSGRFGESGARLHALAGGLDSRPVIPRAVPVEFDVAIDFEPALDRIDQVAFAVRSIADGFIDRMLGAGLVCTAIRVETESDANEYAERSWLHPRSFTAGDVVDRVRWQLQGDGRSGIGMTAGLTRVRIVPESVDAVGNHETGLWGSGPDERVHHGLSRVQSMLGHGAVRTAVIGGGRLLSDRLETIPWGDRPPATASTVVQQPWPGHLPPPLPATVFSPLRPIEVLDARGTAILIDERGALSAPPASFSPTGSARESSPIVAWAGPWPIDERWWDPDHGRSVHRFQLVDADRTAWLVLLDGSHWFAEARYD